MILEKLELSLPIQNFDFTSTTKSFTRHSTLFGGFCKRVLICGPSGVGKSNLLLALLLQKHGLRFKNVFICSQSLHQSKYLFLKQLLGSIPEIGYFQYTNLHEMPSPNKIPNYSIIIFDDLGTLDLNIVKQFFSYGRHNDLDCILLTQTYTSIPKQLLRDNVNLLILFPQDRTNLRFIHTEKVCDIDFKQFLDMCHLCWATPYGFLFIDTDLSMPDKYRNGFDKLIKF